MPKATPEVAMLSYDSTRISGAAKDFPRNGEELSMRFQRTSWATACAIAVCCGLLYAQDGMGAPAGRNPANSSMSQDTMGGTAVDPAMKDKLFLRKASAGGMFEVQAGQVAAQKGNTDAVKSFGQQMVTDHTRLNDDMKPFAQKMGVNPPEKLDKKDQAELDKLNGLSGAAFDNEYITCMVRGHRKDLHEFRMEAGAASDAELKTAVEGAVKVIHHHLMMIEKIAKDQNVSVPEGHGHKAATP